MSVHRLVVGFRGLKVGALGVVASVTVLWE